MRDVIVIGCGGGGPVVAKELAAQGLDVLVLEAGPRFLDPEKEWSQYENDANNPTSGYLRVGPGDRSQPQWSRSMPQDSFVWQVSGVGGTTLHYYGNHPRAVPGVFQGYAGADKDNYDTGHLFPFSFDELRPYFEWVEETLPVLTAPMGRKERLWYDGCERMGLPVCTTKDPAVASFRPQENAILHPVGTAGKVTNPTWPDAQGCTFCGHCFQGCVQPRKAPRNLKARRSTDNTYVPMMLTADLWSPGGKPATLLADAFVQRVHVDRSTARPKATGVTFRRGGQTYREDAKVVVMAAGAVETPRLWFNSGLPNQNDWVGRGFTDHHMDFIIGEFDDDTGNTRGANSCARADFPGYGGLESCGQVPGLEAFAATYSDSGFAEGRRTGSPATAAGADTLGRIDGPALLELLKDANKVSNVLVITDDDVEPDNRVRLARSAPVDANGPIAQVNMRHRRRSARTQRNREFLAAKGVELLRKAGAKKVHRMDWPPLILHAHSTMRMGIDPANSVCDEWGESRAVEGLYIADNSVLANGLGGPNPTNTTQAVGTRTAERIVTAVFGGDPWVKGGAPVSSIDDRVTQGVIDRNL